MLVAITTDAFVLRNLERVCQARAEELVSAASLAQLPALAAPPTAVVIDLDVKDAHTLAAPVKAQWANTLIAGFLSYPNRKLWEAAEAAGFHLVTTRGALAAQLQAKLKDWRGSAAQRIRVCDAADLAGRLGVVMRLEEASLGPIAIYHIGGEVFAAQDICPHAGARLSQGELVDSVITCPRHGSQFDVRTGERLRGPSDLPIKTFHIEQDNQQVFILKDEG